MPTLKLTKLSSAAETPKGFVAGNLYVLEVMETFGLGLMEDRTNAGITRRAMFVFDLRRRLPLRQKRQEHEKRSPVPIPPVFQFEVRENAKVVSGGVIYDGVSPIFLDQVYLIDLAGNQEGLVTEDIRRLFPCAEILNISGGDSDWGPANSEERRYGVLDTIRAVEDTEWTGLSEQTIVGADLGLGPFEIFFFPATKSDKSASVLITGETNGRPFSFFFGNPIFKRVFPGDRVKDLELATCHLLSAGTWRAFYSIAESKSSLPDKCALTGVGA